LRRATAAVALPSIYQSGEGFLGAGPNPESRHDFDASAEALSISSVPKLIELLRIEVAGRVAEDDAKYESLVRKLEAWRAERRTETSVILDALDKLSLGDM